MKFKYLFPNKYKKIGWFVLIPSVIVGIIITLGVEPPSFLTINVPAIFIDELFGDKKLFGLVKTNIFDEVLSILIIVSSILVGFSKEKQEDEFIAKIRIESLVWATYVNYGILVLAIAFVFEIAFLQIMIFNMFTILLVFIVRFNWLVYKLNKAVDYEE